MKNLKPVQLTPSGAKPTDVLRSRSAFTLLEVILALAILAGAMTILGELVSMSGRLASDTTDETRAQLLATSVMDQMLIGHLELTQQSEEPLEVEDSVDWVYSVSFDDTEIDTLTSVEVLVKQDLEKKFRPVKYRLVRWVPSDSISEDSGEDSDKDQEEESSEDTDSEKSSDKSSASSSSSSSSEDDDG